MKSSRIDYCYQLEFDVRDYEVDMFGVVNHAVYPHYLEHTRHTFLHTLGISIAGLRERGCNPVVTRLEIDYKSPLFSGEHFVVKMAVVALTRVRFVFIQDIFRYPQLEWTTHAHLTGTVIAPNGRPLLPPEFELLKPYLTASVSS